MRYRDFRSLEFPLGTAFGLHKLFLVAMFFRTTPRRDIVVRGEGGSAVWSRESGSPTQVSTHLLDIEFVASSPNEFTPQAFADHDESARSFTFDCLGCRAVPCSRQSRVLLLFVCSFQGLSSSYLWEDEREVSTAPNNAEGGEQGETLRP